MIAKEDTLTGEIKREILVLYELGVNIDEIIYIVRFKFNHRKGAKELIDFLFSSV